MSTLTLTQEASESTLDRFGAYDPADLAWMVRASESERSSYLLGAGTTRVVYELSTSAVVKFARHIPGEGYRAGKQANKAEARNFLRHQSSELRHLHLFAPILAIAEDWSWLVQEKCESATEEQVRNFGACEGLALWRLGIEDLHCDNFGVRKTGEVVLVDYSN